MATTATLAAAAATTTAAAAAATATTVATMQQQHQQQRPLRGISIIIESEPKPITTAATIAGGNNSNSSNNHIVSDEMPLKSQSILLAFGDNNGSSNLQTLQVDHANKVDLETSCHTAAATSTAAALQPATKLYPQLLLRIGQSEAEAEAEAATATAAAAEAEMEAATATAAVVGVGVGELTPATTIISCNVADAVRNVLPSGEIKETNVSSSSSSIDDASQSQLMLDDWRTTTATAAAAAAEVAATSDTIAQHTVKIQIADGAQSLATSRKVGKQISVVKLNDSQSNCDMVLQQQQQQQQREQQPYQQLCYLVSSGQYSPCETLDSGTGSDLESIKSPDINSNSHSHSHSHGSNSHSHSHSHGSNNTINESNIGPKLQLHLKTTRIRVANGTTSSGMPHMRAYSLTDSEECDESSSSLSCDSLHSNEAAPPHKLGSSLLPNSLLHDIRNRSDDADADADADTDTDAVGILQHVAVATKINGRPLQYEADQYYNFHVNEHANYRSFDRYSPDYEQQQHQQQQQQQSKALDLEDEDAFVGYRDVRHATQASTIRSSKGTVRGVKNRVRNGVATFLQLQQPNVKNYKEKDVGKVVLYTTSMGIIRDTYGKCANVKQILRTLLIKFEERDVFMSLEYQQEMRDRMQHETIRVPQLFVEGQHIGDADTVERLNESGELRQLLRPYKSIATAYTCQMCGGYRLLPCPSCNGSKKSVHRNHFTAEFVALKCMNCDEVGLVKCPNC